ncbi:WbuC family cupin fold metalloprotein [Chitinivorax sp. PXF-14]|uniref:WbuC family cupin fold metalloprotein n=1 Tax=Chitinivorax sp. PXF-14 TaxID=3230488 RepID=UPI003465C8E0
MKTIDTALLDTLAQQAQQSPRRRANHNLHTELADPIQRLAIAMEPDTYVRPHRHPHTWELLYSLRGRFLVLHFDEQGTVTGRAILGDGTAVLETPAGTWHAVLSLDEGGVIFEVKHGPYQAITDADFAAWSPAAGDAADELMDWYAAARIGERFEPAAEA